MDIEEAIEGLKNGKFTAYSGSTTAIYKIKDVETVLSYISELEEKVENYMKLSASSLARGLNESIKNKEKNKTDLELLNEGWKQIIRDKIKEIEKNPNNPYQKVMASQIDASLISCLKELLDEE